MFDINSVINEEIQKERLSARSELAKQILHILSCPKSPSEYIDKVQEAKERLLKVIEEYQKFQSGIPF